MNYYITWGIVFLVISLIYNHFLEPMNINSILKILLHTLVWPIFVLKFIWDYIISPKIHKEK
jgi:uncharacterized protein YqhQ